MGIGTVDDVVELEELEGRVEEVEDTSAVDVGLKPGGFVPVRVGGASQYFIIRESKNLAIGSMMPRPTRVLWGILSC